MAKQKFLVTMKSVGYCSAVIEAEDKEEAELIADNMDGGDFQDDETGSYFEFSSARLVCPRCGSPMHFNNGEFKKSATTPYTWECSNIDKCDYAE